MTNQEDLFRNRHQNCYFKGKKFHMSKNKSDPKIIQIDENNIVLRCVADNKPEFIEKAVLNGWKQCATCKYPICNECLKIFLGENPTIETTCPGSFLKFSHALILEPIPTELILVEAKKNLSQLPPIGLLIDKAFYSNPEHGLEHNHSIHSYIQNNSVFLAKQEQWANMGSVIVKRNRGKYISWERLSNI